MRSLLLLSFLLLAVLTAHARVGETRAQIEARYGVGKEVGDQVLYTEGAFGATVFYDADGPQSHSTMEIFGHRPAADGQRPEFLPAEIDALLQDQGAGQAWQQLTTGAAPTWRRADNQVFARFQPKDQALIFLSPSHTAIHTLPGMRLQDGKPATSSQSPTP